MALRYAVASGNWSSNSTWNGTSSVPGNGDTVVANGFTVTCDVDITIGGANNPSVNAGSFVTGCWYQITTVGTTSFTGIGASANTVGIIFQATGVGTGNGVAKALATITTAAAGGTAVAGGGFTITTSQAFSADVRAGTTTCLTVTGTGSPSWTSSNIIGGSATNAVGVLNNATAGILTFSGCTIVGLTGTNANGINNNSTGTVTATSCTIMGGSSYEFGINNNSTGTVTATSCTIMGGSGGFGVYNTSTGTLSFTGCTITGGTGSNCFAVVNAASGTLNATGCTVIGSGTAGYAGIVNSSVGTISITTATFTATSTTPAFMGSSVLATVTLQGSQYDHANGTVAVYCIKYKIGTTPSLMQYRKALDGASTYLTLYTSDFSYFGNPAIADVRRGVSFGSGLTGTAYIPAAASVAYGVNVDATTGTAVLDATAVQTALTNQGYTTTRAGYLDTLNDLVAAIWASATRTLSAFGFTVATNSDTNVTAIKAKTDNLPASPAATGDIPTANITAIKAKTDNLPASPAATGDTTGLTSYGASTLTAAQVQAAVIPLV